jgi:hypothetical protein
MQSIEHSGLGKVPWYSAGIGDEKHLQHKQGSQAIATVANFLAYAVRVQYLGPRPASKSYPYLEQFIIPPPSFLLSIYALKPALESVTFRGYSTHVRRFEL